MNLKEGVDYMNCRVIGGTVQFKKLRTGLSEKDYDLGKAYCWLNLLKQYSGRPVKWGKPTRNGTSVKFETFKNEADMKQALGELRGYIEFLNGKYPDLEMTLEA
jgi:hypothetical protein